MTLIIQTYEGFSRYAKCKNDKLQGELRQEKNEQDFTDNIRIFQKLINELKTRYDVILVDNAPSNLVTDGAIVRQYTNVDLFVVRQGYSNKNLIDFINQLTDNNRLKKTGIVLNDVNHQKYYGSYSYRYGGYYQKA